MLPRASPYIDALSVWKHHPPVEDDVVIGHMKGEN